MDRPQIEVILETPVEDESKGTPLTKLVIRKPRVRELRLATDAAEGKGTVALARELLAVTANVLPAIIDRLELEDFNRANEALGQLMPKALQPAAEAGGTARGF